MEYNLYLITLFFLQNNNIIAMRNKFNSSCPFSFFLLLWEMKNKIKISLLYIRYTYYTRILKRRMNTEKLCAVKYIYYRNFMNFLCSWWKLLGKHLYQMLNAIFCYFKNLIFSPRRVLQTSNTNTSIKGFSHWVNHEKKNIFHKSKKKRKKKFVLSITNIKIR